MLHRSFLLLGVVFTFTICMGEVQNPDLSQLARVVRGEVQSCEGCQLNRLSEVKSFIYNDIQTYNNVNFKPIPGATPQLVLFDESNEEITRVNLAPYNRKECNDLLDKWGFTLKSEDTSEEESSEESHEEL